MRRPAAVAIRLAAGLAAPSSIAWTARAPSSPINPRIWPTTSPRTASGPKKKPAIAMAMMRTGASANSV